MRDTAYETDDGPARLNEQLGYAFDAARNLLYRTNNALVQQFQVNSLNELTNNSDSGTMTVVGNTTSHSSSVTVNGASAYRYGDNTFAVPGLPLTNAYTAVGQSSYGASATNTVSVAIATNATFEYDANGNLTNDGLRNFAYDDENQLVQVWVSNQWMSQYFYDGVERRRIRKEFTWQSGVWQETNEIRYIYDGGLVIQERDSNNVAFVTYTRGTDLSGTLAGAGGIGGLLARTALPYSDVPSGQTFYHSDGNGNVTMLIDSGQGVVAKYLYDAYGNTISKVGLLADANVYRFSTKEWDQNPALTYYGRRFYDPALQRWLNRDPIAERGGLNLYVYVGNNPINRIDPLGLAWWQFWNWSIFNWNKPSLPLSTVNAINSSGTGIWIDPSLSDENTFDNTFIGSFSLNNLANGNIGAYGESVAETVGVKGSIYALGRTVCSKAANVAAKGAGLAGAALTVGATAYDLGNGMIQHADEQLTQSMNAQVGNGPTTGWTPVGDGVAVFDESQFFQ